MTDEPTMICDEEDSAAIRSMLADVQALVDEIKRLRDDVTAPDRAARIEAVTAAFNKRIEELATYGELINAPVIPEGNER